MIWLTWRQFRAQAITAAAALAAFAILLATSESHLSSLYDSSGLLTCHGGTCSGLASQFLQQLSSGGGGFLIPGSAYMILYFFSVLVILIAPAIIGCFWGAPLIARELEAGTFRLAWNQSITRTRWLAVKLALIGVAAMAVVEAFSLIQAWWAAPIGKAVGLGGGSSIFSEGRFGWFVFPTHGITPLSYAAFGFALGVTAGLLTRRPIPAMAITLAIFAAVQFITPLWIRPNLFPTSQTTATIATAGANVSLRANPRLMLTAGVVPGQPGAWIISSEGVNAAGQPVRTIPAACEPAISHTLGAHRGTTVGPGTTAVNNCVASHGIRVAESYQPASHYWPLQWSETGMFLILALALAGYCFWRLNRRRS
jgi:ABC-type transport system involved in multi-copper enzyme maturation permease subunit